MFFWSLSPKPEPWKKMPWPELDESETVVDTKGYWIVEKLEEKKGYSLALYHVFTNPGFIPLGLGWIVNIMTEKRLPQVISALNNRMEKLTRK